MGHNITEEDGFFTVREKAWHGLGVVLDNYPTRQEAQAIAHPWEVEQEPIYRKMVYVHEHTDCPYDVYTNFRADQPERTHEYKCGYAEGDLEERYEVVDGSVLNTRSDSHRALGVAPVSRGLIHNSDMYDIAEALEKNSSGDVMFETGGSLGGGARVWLLLRLKQPLIVKGDPHGAVIPFYALQNSHDGSSSFRGQATATRIVCQNTAQMADHDAQQRGTEFVFRHTSKVQERIEEAQHAMEAWRQSVSNYHAQMQHLQDINLTDAQVNQFIDRFLPMPAYGSVSDRVMDNANQAQEEFRKILGSVTCEGISRTSYGLVQASVEYVQWGRKAHTEATRFRRTFLDRNRVISDATRLAELVSR